MTDRKYARLWLSLSLAVLAVIWGNSCLPGEESGALSNAVLVWLLRVLPFLGWMDGFIIRKLAHFCEFALLGCLLGLSFRSRGAKQSTFWYAPAALSLAAACVDETIQIVSPGRYSSLVDVWIDFAGSLSGLVFLSALLALKFKKSMRK